MKIVVGLGNPGREYEWNRHNIGFLAVDFLVNEFGCSASGKKWKSEVFQGRLFNQSAVLLKPQTFMNLSGQAVQAVLGFYKMLPQDVLIIYDDFDLPFGTVRFREKGSAGTHNGMKSVLVELGTVDVPRLRLGIGPKPEGRDVSGFVLSDFSLSEKQGLNGMFEATKPFLETFLN
jgi:PTH1 family peptidyl-tRNA hydrolase